MAEDSHQPAEWPSTSPSSSSKPNFAPIFAASNKRVRVESVEGNTFGTAASSTSIEVVSSAAIKKTKVEKTVSTSTLNGTFADAVASTSSSATQSTPQKEMSFRWLASNTSKLLHGIYGPPHFSSKVACFDIDGTLIATASGAKFPKDAKDWIFWCGKGNVQARLKEYHQKGYSIVFVSNQNYPPGHAKHQAFKSKVPLIAKSLGGIPFRVMAATAKDEYRKPNIGMWNLLNQTYTAQGSPLDKAHSFYVGDAAGRPARTVKAPLGNGKFKTQTFVRDHADSDKGWAKNVGIAFYTPEEFFWDKVNELMPVAAKAKDEVDAPSP